MATTFDHIHMRCRDVAAAVSFYVDILGAEIEGEYQAMGMPITRVIMGGLVLSFSPPREGVQVTADAAEPGWGLYQIGVNVDSLEQIEAKLKSAGLGFCRGPVRANDKLRVAFVDGPDGVEIELMERS